MLLFYISFTHYKGEKQRCIASRWFNIRGKWFISGTADDSSVRETKDGNVLDRFLLPLFLQVDGSFICLEFLLLPSGVL